MPATKAAAVSSGFHLRRSSLFVDALLLGRLTNRAAAIERSREIDDCIAYTNRKYGLSLETTFKRLGANNTRVKYTATPTNTLRTSMKD